MKFKYVFFICFCLVPSRIWHSTVERHLFVPLMLKEFHARKNTFHHCLALNQWIQCSFDSAKNFNFHISVVLNTQSDFSHLCIDRPFFPFRISCCLLGQDIFVFMSQTVLITTFTFQHQLFLLSPVCSAVFTNLIFSSRSIICNFFSLLNCFQFSLTTKDCKGMHLILMFSRIRVQ